MLDLDVCKYNVVIKHGQAPADGNQALLTTERKYNTNNQRTNGTITTQQAHLITIIVTLS